MNTTTKAFYIAGSFKMVRLVNTLADKLTSNGFSRTYDWSNNQAQPTLTELHDIAYAEYQGIVACDFFVFVFPGGKGANIEFGIATALNKPIYIFDTTNALEEPESTSTFYLMDHVHRFYGTADEFSDYVSSRNSSIFSNHP
ncbi:nucleoside 2-deoxyribosyltransferase [Lactiplantibacillus mudanjiangensis]|uniref:Group-specific protein n=1 Tax=Lactiplantibacillus mudanjiangensis TaxID=1296538 RepID=A0A660DUV8_9LACO|nr:nucleoside 2-deoxyribosyltransferase [Lactiplantibacillus mudanjiangensis]VDG22737.1 hypothetical protein [Lactobacillus brevis] [Lactiplantibacillus mudanjiangensis]VDG26726.1 hypothetical protein [Lactobacillus brevis] [Lactiplantibacillus mudanjiangensis]